MNDKAEGTLTRIEPEKKRGGQWIRFGSEEYQVPPLAFRAVIELQDDVARLAAMGQKPTPEQVDTVTRIVHSALLRNYPQITKDEVGDMLDVGNFQEVINATLAVAGFKKETAGGPPLGEATASAGMAPTAH